MPPEEKLPSQHVLDPKHYQDHPSGLECIDVAQYFNFNLGNAIKYIWRLDHKHPGQTIDLVKAIRYLQFELKRLNPLDFRRILQEAVDTL